VLLEFGKRKKNEREKNSGATTQRRSELSTTSPRDRSLDVRENDHCRKVLKWLGRVGNCYRRMTGKQIVASFSADNNPRRTPGRRNNSSRIGWKLRSQSERSTFSPIGKTRPAVGGSIKLVIKRLGNRNDAAFPDPQIGNSSSNVGTRFHLKPSSYYQ
jgi:hypothetical protein